LRELASPIPAPAAAKKKAAGADGRKGAAGVGETTSKGVKRSRDHDLEKVYSIPLGSGFIYLISLLAN
jgi:hypothetical protein